MITIKQHPLFVILKISKIFFQITILMIINFLYSENKLSIYILFILSIIMVFLVVKEYLIYKRLKIEINNEQLVIVKGILSIQYDYVELYRVKDYRISQSILFQILGLMTLTIFSSDELNQIIKIEGIKFNMELLKYIRNRVEETKANNPILTLNN